MILTREMKEKLARHYDVPEFKEYPLQVFAEAVQGKKIVYLYRVASKEATANGTTLAFTTENSRTMSKDADSTATKDGSIRTPGTAEVRSRLLLFLPKGILLLDELEKQWTKMNSWKFGKQTWMSRQKKERTNLRENTSRDI